MFFPFGRPEGALKATLALLECVLHKDMVMPPSQDEVRGVIKKCLENAALVNYTKLSADTRIEGEFWGLKLELGHRCWLLVIVGAMLSVLIVNDV